MKFWINNLILDFPGIVSVEKVGNELIGTYSEGAKKVLGAVAGELDAVPVWEVHKDDSIKIPEDCNWITKMGARVVASIRRKGSWYTTDPVIDLHLGPFKMESEELFVWRQDESGN